VVDGLRSSALPPLMLTENLMASGPNTGLNLPALFSAALCLACDVAALPFYAAGLSFHFDGLSWYLSGPQVKPNVMASRLFHPGGVRSRGLLAFLGVRCF